MEERKYPYLDQGQRLHTTNLLRPIRRRPPKSTQKMLKRLLTKYGIFRHTAARMMGVAEITFDRYCLPPTSKHHQKIPLIRWQMLLIRVREMHHPQEDVEL